MEKTGKLTKALDITAKVLRVITVPPVMALLLILFMKFVMQCFPSDDLFPFILAIICICVMPTLSYPVSYAVPSLRAKGRDGQRKLAFVFSVTGYLAGDIISHIMRYGGYVQVLFSTYMISVLFLIFFNKIIKKKASGHACGTAGPIAFLIGTVGGWMILPMVILYILALWSSLRLKRHTPSEFILGSVSSVAAFIISYVIYIIII